MAGNLLAKAVVVFVALGHLTNVGGQSTDEELGSEGKVWAVLVAGSYGEYNYRHQADVCHAFQVRSRI